jgi:plasmid stabilization system protein ParE
MKSAELTFSADFRDDVAHQEEWLRHEHPRWIPKLEQGLLEAFELLQSFPQAGAETARLPLRKLVLHKLPLVVWYVFDDALNRVELLRLFHARQQRRR